MDVIIIALLFALGIFIATRPWFLALMLFLIRGALLVAAIVLVMFLLGKMNGSGHGGHHGGWKETRPKAERTWQWPWQDGHHHRNSEKKQR